MSGSKQAARLILTALDEGREEDVRLTFSILDRFFPAGSPACEFERRDLLECVGEEVMTHKKANSACRVLLEHLAGRETMTSSLVQ